MSDAVREQLAEFLRLNPDATAIEAVAHVGADPARWVDVVEEALNTADPVAAVRDVSHAPDPADGAEEDPDPDRPNPGGDADASGSATPEPRDDAGAGADPPSAEEPVATVAEESYPPTIVDREYWVNWILDGAGRKRPVAPWQTGHAYPVEWNGDLPDDDRPETEFSTAKRWADFDLGDADLRLPEDAASDALETGILLPNDRPDREECITLIDWDDVRDPDTEEIHPAAADYIQRFGGYVEVSTSGEGLHQFVLGGLRKRGKFIAPIDGEPFVGDDLPQVEIYDGGRHVAMTGRHVAGTDDDVLDDGQELIDDLVTEFADAEKDAGHRRYTPESGDAADGDDAADVDHVPAPDTGEYHGPTAEELRATKPDDRTLTYHAAVETFYRGGGNSGGYAHIQNWRLEGFAAALGERDGLTAEQIKADLGGRYLDETPVEQGCVHRTPERVDYGFNRAVNGRLEAPAAPTLAEYGVLPPSFDDVDAVEPTAVLPPAVRDLSTAASGWDWKHAGARTDLTIEDARDRTADAIADAYGSGDRVLIEALPTMGKSYGSVLAAAETGEPVTILTQRGHKEQYAQLRDWCDTHGLTHRTLPSFARDCETANGDHGEDWSDRVRGWYARGATPQAIHAHAEDVLGRPLPCQAGEGRCSYAAKWDFDPDTDGSADPEEDVPVDVLIGHYAHAHKPKVTTGRTVVFDEFPGSAYETVLAGDLQRAVSCWLDATDGVPFDSYTDLVENRTDESRRADALLWFDDHGIDADETHVFDDDHAHAAAPLAAFAIVAGEDLGNGYERADLGDGVRAVFDRSTGAVSVLRPPALEYASGIVALDGTPTKRMWELALGERLNHRPILGDAERAEYVRDALNLNLVRTSEYVKPYNSPDHVNTDDDAALLEEIAEVHGERPGVITSSTAEHEYDAAGVLDVVDDTKHYGNVLGSNRFKEKRVGAVIGSNHYGDGYIKKWGGYAGDAVERGDGKGVDLSYTGFGGDVLQHMREHDTLQAAMRFGRDGNGAVVYVHTDTLPDWVPVAAEGRVTRTRGDGERAVLNAAADLETWRTADLAEHPAVDVGERQVFNILNRLAERDDAPIAREFDGRGYVWRDEGIHELNDHGEVTLDPVDLDDVGEGAGRENTRANTIYSWDFLTRTADPGADPVDPPGEPSATPIDAAGAGDTPPDPGD